MILVAVVVSLFLESLLFGLRRWWRALQQVVLWFILQLHQDGWIGHIKTVSVENHERIQAHPDR
jgi:hypothetical protein